MKLLLITLIYTFIVSVSYASNLDENHPGYKVLQSKYFDKFGEGHAAELTKLHKVWPPKWTNKILKDQSNLKELYWQRYGFVPAPYENDGLPTGFPKMGTKSSLNCLYCHSSKMMGESIVGLPNVNLDLQTLMDDKVKYQARANQPNKPWNDKILDNKFIQLFFPTNNIFRSKERQKLLPLNKVKGVANTSSLITAYMSLRDKDMNKLRKHKDYGEQKYSSIDPSDWFNIFRKNKLFRSGEYPKDPRLLTLIFNSPFVSKKKLLSFESDYKQILSFLSTIRAPKFNDFAVKKMNRDKTEDLRINPVMASKGMAVFERKCAGCHGKYSDDESYPNKVIPLSKVGTDKIRLLYGTVAAFNKDISESWIGRYGKSPIDINPDGYLAPSLRGIWATAPYLHNGSVPTIRHLFNSKYRPTIWRGLSKGLDYDFNNIGLLIESIEPHVFDEMKKNMDRATIREYYDTRVESQSNEGHLFPERLGPDEKDQVIEYLKTL